MRPSPDGKIQRRLETRRASGCASARAGRRKIGGPQGLARRPHCRRGRCRRWGRCAIPRRTARTHPGCQAWASELVRSLPAVAGSIPVLALAMARITIWGGGHAVGLGDAVDGMLERQEGRRARVTVPPRRFHALGLARLRSRAARSRGASRRETFSSQSSHDLPQRPGPAPAANRGRDGTASPCCRA